MRIERFLAVCGAALALAGCESGVLIYEPNYAQLYVDGDFEYASRSGELKTGVFGSPFAMSEQSFTALVTGHMKGANRGSEVDFTPTPKGEGSGPYHVAMVFNPPKGTAAWETCGDASRIPTGRGGDAVTLMSGFCIGDTLLSTAEGVAVGVKGPDDARFRELVRQVTLALFPVYDHLDIGGDSDIVN